MDLLKRDSMRKELRLVRMSIRYPILCIKSNRIILAMLLMEELNMDNQG